MAVLSRKQIARMAADRCSLNLSEMRVAIDAFLDATTEALVAGDTVTLSRFGKFYVGRVLVPASKNLLTGEHRQEARYVLLPKFSAAEPMKEAVRAVRKASE